MVLGQALMAGSMVQGAKLRFWVKLRLARVWSEEKNYGLGSNDGGGKCGPGSQTAAQVTPVPARVWSREQNRAPGSSPSECGPRREIMVFGQTLVAGSMV